MSGDGSFVENGILFENLTYSVPVWQKRNGLRNSGVRTILKSVSGCFRAGELTAIMGPSGAGKSSLLNILTGFTKQGVTGTIRMHNTLSTSKQYGRHCSYILQEDNLYGNFSVQETMWMAASLKIANVSDERKQNMIDIVLDTLHLQRTKRTVCAALSGGQRKRLSIALELLDNRPILLLDEPTTGLDSTAAAYCIRLLRNLALEGRTIVCTIHQPAATVYELFDQVFVLAGGQCLYQGSARNTVAYLGANGLRCPQYHNAADFIMEVATGEYGNHIKQLAASAEDSRWRESVQTRAIIEPMVSGSFVDLESPSEWTRFWVLVKRFRTNCFRDWTITYLKWIIHICTAVLFGLIYGDSGSNAAKSMQNLSLLCACNLYMFYTAVLPSVLKFPAEVEIVHRESFNNWYKLHTYYLAYMCVTIPILLVSSITFTAIVFLLTDQPAEVERFARFALVFVLAIITGDGLGLALGACLDPINGTFVGSMITTFKIALCGFLAMPSQVSALVRYAMHLSTLSYTLEASTLALYDNRRADLRCPDTEMYCHYVSPGEILKLVGFHLQNYEYDILMLIGQMLLIKCVGYAVLCARIKSDF